MHDIENGNLVAAGFKLSQKDLLTNLEFAFGEFKTYQVRKIFQFFCFFFLGVVISLHISFSCKVNITHIEEITGLDFGDLRKHDPLGDGNENIAKEINESDDIVVKRAGTRKGEASTPGPGKKPAATKRGHNDDEGDCGGDDGAGAAEEEKEGEEDSSRKKKPTAPKTPASAKKKGGKKEKVASV